VSIKSAAVADSIIGITLRHTPCLKAMAVAADDEQADR
jgi:hypothetical protein